MQPPANQTRTPAEQRYDEAGAEVARWIGKKELVEGGFAFGFWDEGDFSADESTPAQPALDLIDLLRRAHKGDLEALKRFVIYLRAFCHELELLSRSRPQFVEQVASTFSDWPVLYSLKGAGKGALKTRLGRLLSSLDVGGEKASLPAYTTQKHNPDNLWTRYASQAIACIRINQATVRESMTRCDTAQRKCQLTVLCFKTDHKVTYFDIGETVIRLTEWQQQCPSLPERVTKEDVPKLMAVASLAIREFWSNYPDHYADVKRKAASLVRFQTDGEYIDRALGKIQQAMRGLVHK
ncbi:MAG: hypothetical protein ACYDH9_13945 [Limisphaerales bacterium]